MTERLITLCATDKMSLETEIRFQLATALVDHIEFIAFNLAPVLAVDSKLASTVKRILQSIKKEGRVKFYLESSQLSSGSTEAEFIINKYADFVKVHAQDSIIFVMM